MSSEVSNPTPEDEARASGIDVDAVKEAIQAAEDSGGTLEELIQWYEAENGHPWPALNT